MKKIINGKKYDTETAKELATLYTKYSDDCNTTLYKKKTGEHFFLYWNASEETISPCSEADAKEFCERALDGDEYEAIWGEVEE